MHSPNILLRRATRWFATCCLLALVGCGGGGGDAPDGPSRAPTAMSLDTLGPSGGTVNAIDGATVHVPEDALDAEVTIRIAVDSSGAPALPASLRPAGSIYEITPHARPFQRAVTVRLPVPAVTLAANESLVLLHAQPDGSWARLSDADSGDGVVTAEVDTLGWFTVGVVRRVQALATTSTPIGWSTSIRCNGASCTGVTGPQSVTYTVTSNGGVLPSTCLNPKLAFDIVELSDASTPTAPRVKTTVALPLTGGTVTRMLDRPTWTTKVAFPLYLICGGVRGKQGEANMSWKPLPAYPALLAEAVPTTLQAGAGTTARLEIVFAGGAAKATTTAATTFTVPTETNRAVIDWQRSDDQGGSWRSIATSYQNEGAKLPYAFWGIDWRFWTARTGIPVSAADAGALFRARACYAPPDTAAPPCITTRAVPLTVLAATAAPVITTQPVSRLVLAGQTASFTVAATGLPAPTLQWQSRPGNLSSDFADIVGATGTSYTTPVLQAGSNGVQYRVIATNSIASTGSLPASVSVSAAAVAPSISTQPAALTVLAGSDAAFAVRAAGTDALSFQWRRNGVNLTGANGAVLRLAAVDATNAGDYSVVVTNAVGSVTSAAARLTVSSVPVTVVPPTIVAGPAAASVAQGQSVTFTVGVTGTGPFSYQWRKDGTPISGATAAGYTIASAQPANAGGYSVVVTGSGTSVTSAAAALTVTAAVAPVAPTITTQPVSVVVVPGATTTLAVAASGTGPLSYQWRREGSPVVGATGPVLTLATMESTRAGSYTVTVSNGVGAVTSSAAVVVVVGVPVMNVQPQSVAAQEGTTATFNVDVNGSTLRYQWTRNRIAISGANAASYTTPTLLLADDGAVYGVIVYNGAGLVISTDAVLTVTPAPVARSWQTAALLQNSAFQTEGAVSEIAVDGAGNMRAAWIERTLGGGISIVSARLTPADGWAAPATVANLTASNATQVKVAVDDAGNAIVLWLQVNGGASDSVWTSRYTPAGGWSAPAKLDVDSVTSYTPLALAMDAAGNAIAMWRHDIAGSGGASGMFHARFVAGSGWTTASALSLGSGVTSASSPSVGFDGSGNAMAVWVQSGPQGNDIASARWVPGSGWTSTVIIDSGNDGASDPQLAVNANGDAVAVWGQTGAIWSNRRPAGGSWGTAVRVKEPPVAADNPRVAIDAGGNAVVAWRESDGSRLRVWASRSAAALGWTTPVAVSAPGVEGYDHALAGNASGQVVAVWRSFDIGAGRYTTAAATFTPAGGWGAATAIEPTEQARPPKVAVDPNGDAAVVWPRQGTNAWQVWSNRFR